MGGELRFYSGTLYRSERSFFVLDLVWMCRMDEKLQKCGHLPLFALIGRIGGG